MADYLDLRYRPPTIDRQLGQPDPAAFDLRILEHETDQVFGPAFQERLVRPGRPDLGQMREQPVIVQAVLVATAGEGPGIAPGFHLDLDRLGAAVLVVENADREVEHEALQPDDLPISQALCSFGL